MVLRLSVLETTTIIDDVIVSRSKRRPKWLPAAGWGMTDMPDFVDELLSMAKEPDSFSKSELGEMILVAATEILKLREFSQPIDPAPRRNAISRAGIQVG